MTSPSRPTPTTPPSTPPTMGPVGMLLVLTISAVNAEDVMAGYIVPEAIVLDAGIVETAT